MVDDFAMIAHVVPRKTGVLAMCVKKLAQNDSREYGVHVEMNTTHITMASLVCLFSARILSFDALDSRPNIFEARSCIFRNSLLTFTKEKIITDVGTRKQKTNRNTI